jgi:hypothetical protein
MSKNTSQSREKGAALVLLSLNSASISDMSLNNHDSNLVHNTSDSNLFNITHFTQNMPINDDAIIQQPSKKQKTLSTKRIEQNIKKDRYNLEYYLELYGKKAKALINIVKNKFHSDEITKMFEKAIQIPEGSSCSAIKKYTSVLGEQMNEIIDTYDSKEQFADVIKDKKIGQLLEITEQTIKNALELYDYEAQILIHKVDNKFHSNDITTMFKESIQMPKYRSYSVIKNYLLGLGAHVNELIDMCNSQEQFVDVIKGKKIGQLLKITDQTIKNALELYDYEAQILIHKVDNKFHSNDITTMFKESIQMPNGIRYSTIVRYTTGLKTNMNELIDMCNSQEQFVDAIQDQWIRTLSDAGYLEKYNLKKHKAQAEAQKQNHFVKHSIDIANDINSDLTQQIFALDAVINKKHNFTHNSKPVTNKRSYDDIIIQQPSKQQKTIATVIDIENDDIIIQQPSKRQKTIATVIDIENDDIIIQQPSKQQKTIATVIDIENDDIIIQQPSKQQKTIATVIDIENDINNDSMIENHFERSNTNNIIHTDGDLFGLLDTSYTYDVYDNLFGLLDML